MNEQDKILKDKIEKREKFDTMLAYILLIILLVCIIFVLYLKFNNKENDIKQEEYIPKYISLSEISYSLNYSLLANRYMNDSVNFAAKLSENSLVVTYLKNDININLNIPVVANELMITLNEENKEIVTDIYKEIASIICVYYGNEEKYCRYTLDNMVENEVSGIRFVNTDNNTIIYIDTTKSFTVENKIVYNDTTKVSINDTDYILEINNTKVSNIKLVRENTEVTISGNIEKLSEDTSDVSIAVRLYDIEDNLLIENNAVENNNTFEAKFSLNEELKLENIDKYSIEIVK